MRLQAASGNGQLATEHDAIPVKFKNFDNKPTTAVFVRVDLKNCEADDEGFRTSYEAFYAHAIKANPNASTIAVTTFDTGIGDYHHYSTAYVALHVSYLFLENNPGVRIKFALPSRQSRAPAYQKAMNEYVTRFEPSVFNRLTCIDCFGEGFDRGNVHEVDADVYVIPMDKELSPDDKKKTIQLLSAQKNEKHERMVCPKEKAIPANADASHFTPALKTWDSIVLSGKTIPKILRNPNFLVQPFTKEGERPCALYINNGHFARTQESSMLGHSTRTLCEPIQCVSLDRPSPAAQILSKLSTDFPLGRKQPQYVAYSDKFDASQIDDSTCDAVFKEACDNPIIFKHHNLMVAFDALKIGAAFDPLKTKLLERAISSKRVADFTGTVDCYLHLAPMEVTFMHRLGVFTVPSFLLVHKTEPGVFKGENTSNTILRITINDKACMREIPSVPGLFMMTCYTGFEWMVRQPDENGRAVISVKTTDLVGNPSLDYPSTWISKKGQACFAKDLPPTKFLEEVTLLEESAQRNNVFPIQKPAIPLVENMEESQQARPKEQNKEKEAKGDDSSCTIL